MTHEEGISSISILKTSVMQFFKDQGLIKSQSVYETCMAINPRLFSNDAPGELSPSTV